MNVIETRKLTKDFGKGRGLFALDLAVAKGRVHGFLGPNGAGKTTAIRLLLDFLRPDYGAARIFDLDSRVGSREIRSRVGYVPGELAFPDGITGFDFLQQSADVRGGVDQDWQTELMRRLQADVEPKIGKLSKGNRQKIALIDALQHRPDLLILDEPTDGLDPLLRRQVTALLKEHVADGGTVFLSSHIVHEVQTICDDVSIVLAGRLRAQARIRDLIEQEGLIVEVDLENPETAMTVLAAHGATDFERTGGHLRFRVRGSPLACLAALDGLKATNLDLLQGDLEQQFLKLYAGEAE